VSASQKPFSTSAASKLSYLDLESKEKPDAISKLKLNSDLTQRSYRSSYLLAGLLWLSPLSAPSFYSSILPLEAWTLTQDKNGLEKHLKKKRLETKLLKIKRSK